MAKAQKDLSKEKEATLFEMFDYFCSKIDFRKTTLDSIAIQSMNLLFTELKKQKEKYSL